MMTKPKVLILKTDGINCDEELSFAFELAGAEPKTVHINDLRSKKESIKNFQILGIPGGFSYGDDVVSGKILALELTSFLSEELKKFTQRPDTLTIGICNGFQVLIRTGLLPLTSIGEMSATLTNNDSGHFECRWVDLEIDKNTSCKFLQKMQGQKVSYQVAHGEGKFFTTQKVLDEIEKKDLVALRYIDKDGKPTQTYPENPNGSMHAIAGVTDVTGRILGMMPHPERFVRIEQYPNWRRNGIKKPEGLTIFKNMVEFYK
ncbi:MAG: phosphoribosylformylglycinamidine synthase I [Candidatus Levyibacteriota bacterium]